MALPFGFAAPPAICAIRTDVIQRTHHCVESENDSWSEWDPPHSEIFVEDAIFAVSDIGEISMEVDGAEWRCRSLFGQDSINAAKTELGGKWPARGLVLGLDIDTAEETISVPLPKIEGSWTFAMGVELAVGIQQIALTPLQTLRGYIQRWLVASAFWASCVHPVDLLLSYSSEGGSAVSCPIFQVRSGFWDMISLLQSMARDEGVSYAFPEQIVANSRATSPIPMSQGRSGGSSDHHGRRSLPDWSRWLGEYDVYPSSGSRNDFSIRGIRLETGRHSGKGVDGAGDRERGRICRPPRSRPIRRSG